MSLLRNCGIHIKRHIYAFSCVVRTYEKFKRCVCFVRA